MNMSLDMSIYSKNTKKHPVYRVPEVKIEIFEDIPRLHVSRGSGSMASIAFGLFSLSLPLPKTDSAACERPEEWKISGESNDRFLRYRRLHQRERLLQIAPPPFARQPQIYAEVSVPKGKLSLTTDQLIHFINCCSQGKYLIKEHSMPNYVVPGLMQKGDQFLNVQRVKTRIDGHVKTIFESSYITEVCEYD
jgi:hypothetical protein